VAAGGGRSVVVIERNDQVLSAEPIKFRAIVAAVPVQDQELISADCTRLGMLVEHVTDRMIGRSQVQAVQHTRAHPIE
jgi:hypothetical protein